MPSVAADAINAVGTVFWTTVYFVYYLFKGKNEWKCEKNKKPVIEYCCIDGSACTDHNEYSNGIRLRKEPTTTNNNNYSNHSHHDNHNSTPKSFYSENSGIRGTLNSLWQSVKRGSTKLWEFGKKSGKKVWNALKYGVHFLWKVIKCFFSVIYAFIVSNNVPSQTLPSTPKPYKATPSSPNYNKVSFEYPTDKLNESELRSVTKQELEEEDGEEPTIYEDVSKNEGITVKVPDTSESFYYERVFEEPKQDKSIPEPPREKSVPPPPPPPPPPKPVSREPSRARSMTPGGKERKEVKGGIGGFKSDIMDELEEHQRVRQERASVNREMTQSCHPDMAQWKANETVDRSANSTPWRASSVGPTMRRLEQVVSRVEGDDQKEANFVFRPQKIVHSSEEYQNRNKQSSDSGFMMGRSVFSPVEEAEQMRKNINSKQQSYSSPQYQSGNWMEGQRSRNIHNRNDQVYDYQTQKNPFGSAAYKSSPYASHTARRSKTPIRSSEAEGGVESMARQWPPVSNASATVGNARDDWVGKSMRGVEENDDGLVMTMCRRVVEKKKDENWKWRDESGRLLDERHNNTWKGELDTLLRDGPNEGRHWSRTVEKLPTGDTRFQDVNRQYNKEFVVESIVRNY
uniref:HTH myb-type domain-containing protein n=1 Tax=Caenorhabditis tropicalis TaxID=1561998 RepID=A0A1I7TE14_9PELO